MPIYEYHCNLCNKDFELLQEIDEEEIKKCPDCQSTDFFKKVSVSSFKLTGSGWYETDFKNKPSGSKSNSKK